MVRTLLASLLLVACARSDREVTDAAGPPPDGTARPTPPEPVGPAFPADDKAAVLAAVKAATGTTLGEHDCVAWPPSFPRVVAVGAFASDRGCGAMGVFVDRQWFPKDGDVAGLASRDFAAARPNAKEALARAWIDEVVHAFGGRFVTEAGPAFGLDGSPVFTPVLVRGNETGGVVVEGWIQQPPGTLDESAFQRLVYRFAPQGTLTREVEQRFSVQGQRLRDRKAELAAAATP